MIRNLTQPCGRPPDLPAVLRAFGGPSQPTRCGELEIPGQPIPVFENEFWTARQREGHSLHEISYRACYKPQLPAFFITRHCRPNDVVYDPFMGRGTTLIEAKLHGCRAFGNDINPLSGILAAPRLDPPDLTGIQGRLAEIDLDSDEPVKADLRVFFERDTLRELYAWRRYFRERKAQGSFDGVDAWLQMVACNRLTGHSKGFFSVYTLPPNQAVSVQSQRKINERLGQKPTYRDTKAIIWRKSGQLLRHPLPPAFHGPKTRILHDSADRTRSLKADSVDLVVTSPPFLDTVDYRQDNWLRMWFCEVEEPGHGIWQIKSLAEWVDRMKGVFRELRRVLRPGGKIAFEVGEVRKGKVRLENEIVVAGREAGLVAECVMIHSQAFTKTSNCWGVSNNRQGTNSNRIVVFSKPA